MAEFHQSTDWFKSRTRRVKDWISDTFTESLGGKLRDSGLRAPRRRGQTENISWQTNATLVRCFTQ
jgi:hypothetical protein